MRRRSSRRSRTRKSSRYLNERPKTRRWATDQHCIFFYSVIGV
jgi:hypothetical protein